MKPFMFLIALLAIAGCQHRLTPPKEGQVTLVSYRDGKVLFMIVDSHENEGLRRIFEFAEPLSRAVVGEEKSDLFFEEYTDGVVVRKSVLTPRGELFHDGRWYKVNVDWLKLWQSMYDLRNRGRAGTDQ
jgi:hypothetical protein